MIKTIIFWTYFWTCFLIKIDLQNVLNKLTKSLKIKEKSYFKRLLIFIWRP